ncbi:hypothetical protein BT63DRAFT_483037 [Microthyrium microscopicum]|uniref:Uncharacterized protein n=1 Tax=Microthyrium microscopicum TaxID=703497 RepID=A0A6A6TYK2_9PEZI|nr:hypothetical protein BT63DRAFT_483037 [Microthyrium microscopicum]
MYMITLLGAASMAMASPVYQDTITLQIPTSHQQAREYRLVCNKENLEVGEIHMAASKLETKSDSCKVGKSGSRFMEHGGVKVTGWPFETDDTSSPCKAVGAAVHKIADECQGKGGSAQVGDNLNLIVHVSSNWV